MVIVNKENFLKLPEGTVFTFIATGALLSPSESGLFIKGSTIDQLDFAYRPLCSLDYEDSAEQGCACIAAEEQANHEGISFELPIDCDTTQRDGLFDKDALYGVFSAVEVKTMGTMLLEQAEKHLGTQLLTRLLNPGK